MAKGDTFLITARGPSIGEPEILVDQSSITYYGWSGSIVEVYKNGEKITPDAYAELRVPPTPRSPS